MKKVLLFCLTLLFAGILNAQTYLITNGTVNTCSGFFYDTGGSGGNYGNSQNFTYTICATGGQCIRVNFTSFNLESGYDFLSIYNGPSTMSPLIGTYTGTTSPGVVTSTTGCLTFVFTSDAIITAPGWSATISCVTCGSGGGPVTAGDCGQAVTVCTNLTFAVDPSGFGSVNEICPAGMCAANPNVNPASSNSGCLLSGELNSTWLLVTITSSGTLEFSFADNTTPYPQTGFFDWIMWPYSPTACSQILAGTLAPVRCNWNAVTSGGTGMASVLPPGGNPGNYEPPLTVTAGQQFIICFSNWSSLTTNVPLRFFGSAGIACTLPIEFLNTMAVQKGKEGKIMWKTPYTAQYTKSYLVEKQVGNTWKTISNTSFVNGQTSYEVTDKNLELGKNIYKITQIGKDGGYGYSETVELNVTELPVFSFYPNPVTSNLTLQLNSTQNYQISIINAAGQVIYQNANVTNTSELQIDMNKFATGNYWLRVNQEITPFVKQ